jgi:hypothetical protein
VSSLKQDPPPELEARRISDRATIWIGLHDLTYDQKAI